MKNPAKPLIKALGSPECKKWVKELDEETGVCKNCSETYA